MQRFVLNEECAVNTGCPNSGCGAIVHVLQPPYSLFPLAIVGALIVVHVNVLGACVSCRVISYRHNYHHYSSCTCNYANAKANQLETGAGVTIKALSNHLLHPLGHEPHTCIFGITRFVVIMLYTYNDLARLRPPPAVLQKYATCSMASGQQINSAVSTDLNKLYHACQ